MDREHIRKIAEETARRLETRYPKVIIELSIAGTMLDENVTHVQAVIHTEEGGMELPADITTLSHNDLRLTDKIVANLMETKMEFAVRRLLGLE
jgi:hypothetical protein